MRMCRRRIAVAVLSLFCIVLAAPTLYGHVRLNQISIDTLRLFHTSDVSTMDLGLRLGLGDRIDSGPLTVYASTADCKGGPRLSLRYGIALMLNGNPDGAAQCFASALKSNPDALDALVLATSAYQLAGQGSASRATFGRIPESTPGMPPTAAMAMLDYVPAGVPGTQGTSGTSELGNINPRQVLFGLMTYGPKIVSGFLERTAQTGMFSPLDVSDLTSIDNWLERQEHGITISQPPVGVATGDQRNLTALQRSLAKSLGCAENNIELGPNLLPDGLFYQAKTLAAWHTLPWTTGGTTYNRGEFMSGLDAPNGGHSGSALRTSGLWKDDNPNRFPASGDLELTKPASLLAGNSLYLMLVRYKTENIRFGQTELWFDSSDYQRFVGVWRLPPSDGVWQELYALGYAGDTASSVSPLIRQSALGTTWIDYLQIIPVRLNQCGLSGRNKVFGSVE